MSFRTSKWAWISLVCLIGAVANWWLGRDWEQRHRIPAESSATNSTVPTRPTTAPADAPTGPARTTSPAPPAPIASPSSPTNPFPYRLSNATKPISEWIESERAILLRHALVDTEAPLSLDIPPHLRAQGDPGAYVVQAEGAIDQAFRDRLRAVGAEIVSYVPNNAYLVKLSSAGAAQLAGSPGVRTLLPWEPYYKLDSALMPLAVEQRPLPRNWQLNLIFFPGDREAIVRSLAAADIQVVGEERTPFGPQFVVRAPADALVALAHRPDVQALELHRSRVPANDLSRGHVRVATNTTTLDSYQGPASAPLTGVGVLVNVNDTGVDAQHPDLAGRVISSIPAALTDGPGHGTHVAGIIASSGLNDPAGDQVPGSFTNADYRGMAPRATIFVQPLNLAVGPASDTALQENAARTNALISNNSWSYPVREYNFASASWDAAVRDTLPGQSNAQPLVVVFAAGNSGGGNNEGSGGGAGSIDSPANGKNVITVGALESFRNITNEVSAMGMTNQPWLGQTDSSNIVVSFSGRGNVAPGIEGEFGRAKPDLVAPGTFIVSTRSSEWVDPEGGTETIPTLLTNQFLGA
ncbi:MAG TPA: S8 family serine peptidase, partial [Methylomirabilota bacterium]|nr:S8 family serine peptidase [Methylomirabilota bacterium]